MKPIVTFFGTQPYEQESFDALNRDFGFEFRYFKGHLSRQTVVATHGAQAACIFVNDTADAEVMRELARNGVRLLALRCAGYNTVALEAVLVLPTAHGTMKNIAFHYGNATLVTGWIAAVCIECARGVAFIIAAARMVRKHGVRLVGADSEADHRRIRTPRRMRVAWGAGLRVRTIGL